MLSESHTGRATNVTRFDSRLVELLWREVEATTSTLSARITDRPGAAASIWGENEDYLEAEKVVAILLCASSLLANGVVVLATGCR